MIEIGLLVLALLIIFAPRNGEMLDPVRVAQGAARGPLLEVMLLLIGLILFLALLGVGIAGQDCIINPNTCVPTF